MNTGDTTWTNRGSEPEPNAEITRNINVTTEPHGNGIDRTITAVEGGYEPEPEINAVGVGIIPEIDFNTESLTKT